MEAAWNGLDTTEVAFLATHHVNPIWNNLIGKTILITLPVNLDLERLTRFNKVISRYPLESNGKTLKYELVPYSEVEFKMEEHGHYSKKILNKYLLTSDEHDIKEEGRFLLGAEPETNGYLNTIGYLLLKTIKS
jgi:hypothetical protein